MSAVIDLFRYQSEADVRVVVIEGEPWFVAADIAGVLGYSATEAMTRSLDADEKGMHSLHTPGGEQQMSNGATERERRAIVSDDLMGPPELAAYLGVSLATVYAMNHKKTGPRRIRVGRLVRYRRSDVDAWLDAQTVFMGPPELAAYLGVSLATVYAMNHKKTGPRRIRVGRHVRYRRSDVDAWLDAQTVDPEPAA